VRDAIAQLVDSIYKGATDPRVATALTPLLSLQLQVLELYELEQRVCQLEGQASSENNNDRDDHRPDVGAEQPGHLA
jgi:hypothetical protein